jgi:hypothetical protein
MKQLAILLMILFSVKSLPAQQPDADEINKSLEVVIRNLPAGLTEIKGELINKRGQTSRYHSKVTLPGASETFITEQAAFGRKAISWRSVIFSSADADEAGKRYEALFNRLNNSIIRSAADKPFIISGKYKSPSNRQSTVSRFQLLPSTGDMRHVNIDLILEEVNGQYTLSVHVHQ